MHRKRGSADVGRRVRSQKRCGPTDVGRLRQPAQRDGRGDGCLRIAVAVKQFGLFSGNHADHHGIDPDLRRPFDRQGCGEAVYARLGGGVCGGTR